MIRPTHIVHDLSGIDPERFCAENPWVSAISYDKDGTVTDYHGNEVPEAHTEVFRAFAELGVAQGFNTNTGNAKKPEDAIKAQKVAEFALQISETIGSEFLAATSFEAGGRKPGPETFELFAQRSGVPVERTVHIGDQWLKDVMGARKAGLGGAILVARYGLGDDWRVKFGQRPFIETPVRVALRLPLWQKNFSALLTANSQ